MLKTKLALVCFSTMLAVEVLAVQGIEFGAELRYEHLSDYTYSVEGVVISTPINDPWYVLIGPDTVLRTGMMDDPSGGCAGLRRSTYQHQMTFAGPGIYTVNMIAGPRISPVVNMAGPAEPLCVSAMINISPTAGHNNSVVFNGGAIDRTWNVISHDPLATDIDGDSLSFEFVTPMGEGCAQVTGFSFPDAANFLWLDPSTGVWIWDHPMEPGNYTLTIQAKEWREGVMVGQLVRDMTICLGSYQVGVHELTTPSFTISPTLTQGPIRITTSTTARSPMRIFSASGALVMEELLQPGEQWLDLSGLRNGLYLVRVTDPTGGVHAVRVVKQ